MFGFKHIWQSWKTSSAGVALIAGACISVFMGKSTWTDAAPIIGIGIGLLGLKDPGKNNNNNPPMAGGAA